MVTVWVLRFLTGILDQSLLLIPPPGGRRRCSAATSAASGVRHVAAPAVTDGHDLVRNLFGRQIVHGLE